MYQSQPIYSVANSLIPYRVDVNVKYICAVALSVGTVDCVQGTQSLVSLKEAG